MVLFFFLPLTTWPPHPPRWTTGTTYIVRRYVGTTFTDDLIWPTRFALTWPLSTTNLYDSSLMDEWSFSSTPFAQSPYWHIAPSLIGRTGTTMSQQRNCSDGIPHICTLTYYCVEVSLHNNGLGTFLNCEVLRQFHSDVTVFTLNFHTVLLSNNSAVNKKGLWLCVSRVNS